MAHILILGGTGNTGKRIARHLLEQTDAAVTIASRQNSRAQGLAEALQRQYPGRSIAGVVANTSDMQSLRTAFAGHTLVIVASPTTNDAETVVRAALETGIDYLDIQLGSSKWALLQSYSDRIQRAGRCFITEAGFHPGLPSALVRYAATHLESMESAIVAGYLNMGTALPYTEAVDELIDCFRNYQGQIYTDGAWTDAHSLATRNIDFGSDIGPKHCYAMFFEELRLLPTMYPSLRETGFFVSASHGVTDWIIIPAVMGLLKILPNATRPIGKLLWWGMRTFHHPPYRVELHIQASGHNHGERATVLASFAHPDAYEFTAIPVVGALRQYLDGSAKKPGLWMMGHMVEPVRLIQDMERMGVQRTEGGKNERPESLARLSR